MPYLAKDATEAQIATHDRHVKHHADSGRGVILTDLADPRLARRVYTAREQPKRCKTLGDVIAYWMGRGNVCVSVVDFGGSVTVMGTQRGESEPWGIPYRWAK